MPSDGITSCWRQFGQGNLSPALFDGALMTDLQFEQRNLIGTGVILSCTAGRRPGCKTRATGAAKGLASTIIRGVSRRCHKNLGGHGGGTKRVSTGVRLKIETAVSGQSNRMSHRRMSRRQGRILRGLPLELARCPALESVFSAEFLRISSHLSV
jgi:hypothetical protein